ncbi:PD-(D/E)XK nuclease family protein [Segatella copri]|uniref:PDDEXK-like family protein n=1 Tax=Segatella copri TaxID=165179 RepID=UPI002FEECB6B
MALKAIQQLLQEVQPILQKSKAEKKEREAKGEYFSVFEYLNFSRFEEQLHTPFLRMLLDKDANHGVGKGFLQAFLDKIVEKLKPDFQYDINSSHIEYQDVYLGNNEISEDGTSTGGKIDILLHDDKKHAIIIENKFDRYGNPAQDQPKQLERYYNHGKDDKKYEDFILIYLTPSGQYASEDSTGSNKITYYPISYDLSDDKPNILFWLDECLNISKGCPRIHEVIKQYITYIKNTRQIMEKEDQKELLNLLLSEENVDVTLGILRDEQMIKEKIRRDFCDQLVKLAGEYGLELREQYNANIVTWNSDYGWMIFVGKKRHQSQVGFVIGNFSRKNEDYGGMLYGLSIINGYFSNLGELKNVFKIESSDLNDQPLFGPEKGYHQLPENKGNFKREFPFGYSFLYDENREKDKKRWFDWDDLQTLADMRNGKMLDFMRTRFEILKNNGIIDKL